MKTLSASHIALTILLSFSIPVMAAVKENPKPSATVENPDSHDVYNFYFQKAPGPQTVQQGGGGAQVEQPAAPPSEIPSSPTPAAGVLSANITDAKAKPDYYKNLFIATWGTGVGTDGISATYEYKIEKFLGFFGGLHVGLSNTYIAASGGFSLTPVQLTLFGKNLLDLGLVAGVHSQFFSFAPFYGARTSINLSKQISLISEMRMANGWGTSMLSLGYKW